MWLPPRLLALSLVSLGLAGPISYGQSASGSDQPQRGPTLTRLHDPVFSPLARTARIQGDVDLVVGIRQDGSIESVKIVRGVAMLNQSAKESAQQSEFVCRECTDAVTSYSLVYTFQYSNENCCTSSSSTPPVVSESQHHVTITVAPICLCDPAATLTRRVRSARCLYLWKCAIR